MQIKEEYPPEESNKEQQQIKKFHKLRLATQGELIEFFLKEK